MRRPQSVPTGKLRNAVYRRETRLGSGTLHDRQQSKVTYNTKAAIKNPKQNISQSKINIFSKVFNRRMCRC